MRTYLTAVLSTLRTDLATLRARAQGGARRSRRSPHARWRRRGRRLTVVVLPLLLAASGAAFAGDGSQGAANPWLGAFTVKDSHGLSVSSYDLNIDQGGMTSPIKATCALFLMLGWDFYRLIVAIVLWLYDFMLQFKILDILTPPAQVLATTLQTTIGRVGLVSVLLLAAFIVCAVWIQSGKAAAGILELVVSLTLAAAVGSVLANPVAMLTGPHGAIAQARDFGVGLSAQVLSGGANTSSDPTVLQQQTSAKLVDTFVRVPHQLINYGAVIDRDPTCVKIYDKVLGEGPWGDDSTPRDRMGDCNKAYKAAAENPQSGLQGMAFVSFGGSVLLALMAVLVLGMALITAMTIFEGAKFVLALLKGIIPGAAREDVFVALGVMCLCLLTIIGVLFGIGIVMVAVDSLFATTSNFNPLQTFIVMDLLIVLAFVFLILTLAQSRKRGKKLGERMHKALSPQAKAVQSQGRPQPMRMVMQQAGQVLTTKKALGGAPLGQARAAAAGSGAGAVAAGGAAGASGVGAVQGRGSAVESVGRGAWQVTKLGLASTVGAPVYAPRAYGAVKNAAVIRKAALHSKFDAAKAQTALNIGAKTGQVKGFGQEYVHNVGVAARTVSKVSGATHVAKAAMSLGADPMTAGAAAAVTYLASNRRPVPPAGPPTTGIRPAPPSPGRPTAGHENTPAPAAHSKDPSRSPSREPAGKRSSSLPASHPGRSAVAQPSHVPAIPAEHVGKVAVENDRERFLQAMRQRQAQRRAAPAPVGAGRR